MFYLQFDVFDAATFCLKLYDLTSWKRQCGGAFADSADARGDKYVSKMLQQMRWMLADI
jgi:hypothetical protein